jgi:hypothetical protein
MITAEIFSDEPRTKEIAIRGEVDVDVVIEEDPSGLIISTYKEGSNNIIEYHRFRVPGGK